MKRPMRINENHWREWVEGSKIDRQLTALNLESLAQDLAYRYLLIEINAASRRKHPDAQWRWARKKYGHIEKGGWWCSGLDPLNDWKPMLWGCLKADFPRFDGEGKPIKYEHPPKCNTRAFFLRVPLHIWQAVAQRYDVAMPEEIIFTEDFEPIGFWAWVLAHPQIPIVICEGVKKAAALLSIGLAAIAIPGIFNGFHQPKDTNGNKIGMPSLIPEFKIFAQEGREILFCFDQDSKRQTRRNVNEAIRKTGNLFIKSGCTVRVITWHPNFGKGVDDVILNQGKEFLENRIDSGYPLPLWQIKQHTQLSYPADLTLNSRYLGIPLGSLNPVIHRQIFQVGIQLLEQLNELPTSKVLYTCLLTHLLLKGYFPIPPKAQLICLKAPKGTGKTFWLSKQVEPFLNEGLKVLLLTHRIQLGEELCNRIGIHYLSEKGESEAFGINGYGLCVDSLWAGSHASFNPQRWEGAWIVIDEIEQVIWHLLNSSTCRSERVAILRALQEVIQVVLSTGGKILIADADLSDVGIDFIRSLAGFDLEPWIVENEYKPNLALNEGWLVYSYEGKTPSQLMATLEKHIERGGKPFICVSGQKKKSLWGTQIVESHLRKKFPSLRILRIDRESIADPSHPAYGCISHLNKLLPSYDIVIASPTIETGVSIQCHHFTSVWGIFQGVQTADSVRQALARVRTNIPRFIWVRKTGFNKIAHGETSVKALLATQHKLGKAHVALLAQAGFIDEVDLNFQPISLHTWAIKAAIVNMQMKAYRNYVLSALEEEGHTILNASELNPLDEEDDFVAVTESESEQVENELKATKEADYQNYCYQISEQSSLDDNDFFDLKDKRAKSESERLQFRKGEIARRYQVAVTPELVALDEDGWFSKIQLHYYLTTGREYLSPRDINRANELLGTGNGAFFLPDFNRSQLGWKVRILQLMGFHRLLEQREYRGDDPTVVEIDEFCKKHSFEIKAVLGISVSPRTSPMFTAQQLAQLIGYRFPRLRREGARGQQVWVYGSAAPSFERGDDGKISLDASGLAIPIPDGRDEVFSAWEERDRASQSEIVEAATSVTAANSEKG